jgi:pentatricopeptide repeat protein
MTERCKCQRCWYKYAAFLVGQRPEKMDEARHALEVAESKARSGKVSRKEMNMLRLRLLQETAPPEAEALARELLDVAPEEAAYWWHLAAILRTQERHAEAAEAAGRAVELDPNAPYRARLANCLAKAGDLDAAQQVYDEMLSRHPERLRYWYWYAEFLADYHPDRIDEAHTALEKATNLPDGDRNWSVPAADLAELEARLDTRQEILQ